MLKKSATVVIGLLIVSMAVGCGKKRSERRVEKAIERETGGKANVKMSGDKFDMKIKTDDGEVTIAGGGGAKIPKDFPKDVHVYKGASVTMSMTQPDGMVVGLQTKDALQKAVETYKKQMEAQGWKEKTALDIGEAVMLAYEKSERAVSISFTQSDDGTQISITLQK